jgi:hypothetical protein
MARRIPIAPVPQTPEQQHPHIDMPDNTLPPGSTMRRIPQAAPEAPFTWTGFGKAGATGVRGGAEGGVGMAGDIPDLAGRFGRWAAGKLPEGWVDPEAVGGALSGATETMITPAVKITRAMEMAGIIDHETAEKIIAWQAPGSADVGAATDAAVKQLPESVSGPIQDITRHQAENPAERFAQTSGEFAGTAFLPGGVIAKATRPLIAGGVVEAAGNAVPAEYEEAARIVAGLAIGAGMGAGQRGFKERSAMRKVGSTPGAAIRVRQLLKDQGMTDQEAVARMKELGSEATLMDVGPEGGGNTRVEAQRIQAAGGPGQGIIDPMLRAREAGSNRRLMEDVGATVGPYRERATELDALEQRLQEKGGEQATAARTQEVQPADPQGIVDALDQQMQSEKSNSIRSALADVRDMMFVRDKDGNVTEQLDTSSSGLLKARQALKQMLYTEEGVKKTGPIVDVVKDFYGKINEAIDPSNPAIRASDKEIEAIAKEKEAFQSGEKTYEKGREAPGPVGHAETWNAMSAEERAAAVRGLGAETYRLLGQFGKDRVTLQNMMTGEGKWPTDKLETMIGPEKTRQLETALQREKIFQETYQKVVQGSKTAATQGKAGGGGIVSSVAAAVPEVVTPLLVGRPDVSLGALGSNIRRMAQDLMTSRGAGAKEAAIAKLLTSQEPDKVAAGLKIMQQRGSIMPQATITALLARQQDVSEKRQR